MSGRKKTEQILFIYLEQILKCPKIPLSLFHIDLILLGTGSTFTVSLNVVSMEGGGP